MEREEKDCQRVFSAVVKNELSYGNIVEPNFLNEDAVAKLGKRDVKWFKLLLKKGMFTIETIHVCHTLNQYLEMDSDRY